LQSQSIIGSGGCSLRNSKGSNKEKTRAHFSCLISVTVNSLNFGRVLYSFIELTFSYVHLPPVLSSGCRVGQETLSHQQYYGNVVKLCSWLDGTRQYNSQIPEYNSHIPVITRSGSMYKPKNKLGLATM
jgi:hypothetical protein